MSSELINIHSKKFKVSVEQPFIEHIRLVQKGEWEPDTFHIFDAFLKKDQCYIDIGAWIGITTLYGSQLAKHCYAMEPDPIAMNYLEENIALNPALKSKITLSKECLYNINGEVFLGNKYQAGDCTSSIHFGNANTNWRVPAITFDHFLKKYSIKNYNFIKMDTEGAEAVILPQMAQMLKVDKPTLFLAIHCPFFKETLTESMSNIISVLNLYKHVFLANGLEIKPSILLNEGIEHYFFEVLATDLSIEGLKKTHWGQSIKALNTRL